MYSGILEFNNLEYLEIKDLFPHKPRLEFLHSCQKKKKKMKRDHSKRERLGWVFYGSFKSRGKRAKHTTYTFKCTVVSVVQPIRKSVSWKLKNWWHHFYGREWSGHSKSISNRSRMILEVIFLGVTASYGPKLQEWLSSQL